MYLIEMRSELLKKLKLRIANEVFTAIALIAIGALLFVSWDSAGRNSFELLGVIHRLDLLPEYIPTRPILMWWTILPLSLIWGIKDIIQGVFHRHDENVKEPYRLWLVLFLLPSSAISVVVSLSPTATSAPRWCLWLSVLAIFALVSDWFTMRSRATEG